MICREKAEELLTDMLAGEISMQDLDHLFEYQEAHPDFAEYSRSVESAWGMAEDGVMSGDGKELASNLKEIISRSSDSGSKVIPLDFDVLDNIAAAGDQSVIPEDEE